MPVRAITFDMWDTLVADDSDEPRRAALGLPTKADARRQLFVDAVLATAEDIGETRALEAYDRATAAFRHAWKVEHHTPSVADRLTVGFRLLGLGRNEPFDSMVEGFETMEVEIPPDMAPGIRSCLDALAGKYPLGIISDAIVTPGRGLREILRGHGLLEYFSVFVFSDEAGAAKPARKVFDVASQGFGTALDGLVHIGDREANDVLGPHGVGAMSVLYTGCIDRGTDGTKASAVCTHHDDLPGVIADLASR